MFCFRKNGIFILTASAGGTYWALLDPWFLIDPASTLGFYLSILVQAYLGAFCSYCVQSRTYMWLWKEKRHESWRAQLYLSNTTRRK